MVCAWMAWWEAEDGGTYRHVRQPVRDRLVKALCRFLVVRGRNAMLWPGGIGLDDPTSDPGCTSAKEAGATPRAKGAWLIGMCMHVGRSVWWLRRGLSGRV